VEEVVTIPPTITVEVVKPSIQEVILEILKTAPTVQQLKDDPFLILGFVNTIRTAVLE
jgi:hypothetical protein